MTSPNTHRLRQGTIGHHPQRLFFDALAAALQYLRLAPIDERSIKTVSRVINNLKTVKPQLRERVARAIEKLDYHRCRICAR